ncbi:MAG: NAD(P)/FAD-dependent oxidoreductase [Gammaproteobacteria bacterium]|nr:NAD(P)/FAD-dependent oxidoreductase [Gammaproteobacteria bacterium]MCY4227291.1 NAD(P)/FAD-dependent oxidoreductase [Gammaproteobacteria bacterium]
MAVYASKVEGLSLGAGDSDVKMLIADFPFDYGNFLSNASAQGIGEIPAEKFGTPVAVVGGGVSGITAAYELMRLGLKPEIYEDQELGLGGRFQSSQLFDGTSAFAEMGAMRFPPSATGLFHYINLLDLETEPFPNPLTNAARSTLIELLDESYYIEGTGPVPEKFASIADKWNQSLENYFEFTQMQTAIKDGDANTIKSIWNQKVKQYDNVSFYQFLVEAGFTYDEIYIFGQVGFGSGGWNTDYPNSILEILRVVYTNADDNHQRIIEGTTSLVEKLWERQPADIKHWPAGTSLKSLNGGLTSPAVVSINPGQGGGIQISTFDVSKTYEAAIVTPEKRVLRSGAIQIDESLFGQDIITAIDNTHYELSGKVFSKAQSPIWTEKNSSGRYRMSMTLSDRLTRGTYLFDESGGSPMVCLSYTWNDDTLKFLPFNAQEQFNRCVRVLQDIYPNESLDDLFQGKPISVIWDKEPQFIGAFKNNLPGQYRIQRDLFTAFKEDEVSIAHGVFLAGDDISWTGGWSEGAIHSGINAAWGVLNHLGGSTYSNNQGPGDDSVYSKLAPIKLDGSYLREM